MSANEYKLTTYYYDTNTQSFSEKSTNKALGYNDVLIKTTHSGICFTDVHAKDKKCGLGHEGVGTAKAVGPAVKHLETGDRVGWGWLNTSCGHRSTCATGYRQIINSEFAYRIPKRIPSTVAAPLMCAGASVFEALDAAGTKSNDRVGVVGIGGLGHMAILFARAFGCAVTAISNGTRKMQDAFELGADDYRDSNNISTANRRAQAAENLDPGINVLLITSNAEPNLETVLPLLARRATIVLMTIQMEPLSVPYMQFVLPGHRMIASTEASRENHIKMLEFAERRQINHCIEVFDMNAEGLTKAFERLEGGEMRYRGVLARQ